MAGRLTSSRVLTLAALTAVGLAGACPGTAAQSTRPTFRVAVDLIPVDVQVVDSAGQPVTGLTADRFEVTINGRRRKVVSADMVDYGMSTPVDETAERATATPAPGALERGAPPGRIFILAVDANSLDESRARPVIRAAADFVRRLGPDDEVGLFAYPIGPSIDPTIDHDAVVRALEHVIARHDVPPAGEFALAPNDLVELSRIPQTETARQIVERFCGRPPTQDEECVARLENEVRGQILVYESVAQVSAGSLRSLMVELGKSPLRKTLVLVSGGVVSSDIPGGRPDNHEMGLEIGRAAAESNVNVYALYVDGGLSRVMSAETGRAQSSFRPAIDSQLTSRWLDQFAGSAGGSMIRVVSGDGGPAFAQVLRETSAFYLLGVEPGPDDRDGRIHELRVRVQGRQATIRGRSWVLVPRPGTPPADLVGSAAARPASPAPAATRLPPPPPAVMALADAFLRNDRAAIARDLAPRNANLLIEAFRTSASPWPAAPRRTAIFALDVAAEGLRSSSPYTTQEAVRLLAEYMVRIRPAEPGSAFECAWLWTASAALEGLFQPAFSTVLVDRAAERCPGDPNLLLARAVVRDQELMDTLGGLARAAGPTTGVPEPEQRVLDLYRLAAGNAATRSEANIRAAYVHLRGGRPADGLGLLDAPPPGADDRPLVYTYHLVRGQILAALGRLDEAADAFRAAGAQFPDAPSARIGLMATSVRRGDPAQAARLAESILATDPRVADPWWLFALGDYRAYDTIRDQLRRFAE